MYYSDAVLGTTTARALQARNAAVILQIGRDRFTRHDLAAVHCYNFLAAANLSRVLNEHLQVADLRAVFDTVHPSQLALPGLGAVALAVLGAAFEAKGIGGDHPLEAWLAKHKEAIVTFHTLKARDQAEQQAETKARRQRKAARRDQAQAIRVARVVARSASPSSTRA